MGSCAESAPFLENGKCVTKCSETYFYKNSTDNTSTCLSGVCPSNLPYAESTGQCVAVCASGRF